MVERTVPHLNEEVRYRLLKYLADHPDASQRELAAELGVSLGKVHYCLHALIQKGLVKAGNFKKNRKKASYAYVLTRAGLEEKIRVTYSFLRRKVTEYDAIAAEIKRLSEEVEALTESSAGIK